jgi:hypothetical protein
MPEQAELHVGDVIRVIDPTSALKGLAGSILEIDEEDSRSIRVCATCCVQGAISLHGACLHRMRSRKYKEEEYPS